MPCTGSREGNPLWASNAACSALHSFPNYSWGLIWFFLATASHPPTVNPWSGCWVVPLGGNPMGDLAASSPETLLQPCLRYLDDFMLSASPSPRLRSLVTMLKSMCSSPPLQHFSSHPNPGERVLGDPPPPRTEPRLGQRFPSPPADAAASMGTDRAGGDILPARR